MSVQTNKRLGRTVQYFDDGSRTLFQGNEVIAEGVDVDTAHRWFHGNETIYDPPEIAPTVDDMIDTVAEQMKKDMAFWMDWALADEANLASLHSQVQSKRGRKGTTVVWRPYQS